MANPEEIIRAELAPSEQLLWVGGARHGIVLRAADWFLIPFSLFWCAAVVAGLLSMILEGPEGWLFGAVMFAGFLLIGLYPLLARFWLDTRMRKKICYGVSNERILIVSGMRSQVVKSLPLGTLADVTMAERADGSGWISFHSLASLNYWNVWWGPLGSGIESGSMFELAADVRKVYAIIINARRTLR